jgi:hypothetical protein
MISIDFNNLTVGLGSVREPQQPKRFISKPLVRSIEILVPNQILLVPNQIQCASAIGRHTHSREKGNNSAPVNSREKLDKTMQQAIGRTVDAVAEFQKAGRK